MFAWKYLKINVLLCDFILFKHILTGCQIKTCRPVIEKVWLWIVSGFSIM